MHCVMSHKISPTLRHHGTQTLSPTYSNLSNLPRTVAAQQIGRERALRTTRIYSGHVYEVSRLLMCVPRVLMSATKRRARPGSPTAPPVQNRRVVVDERVFVGSKNASSTSRWLAGATRSDIMVR